MKIIDFESKSWFFLNHENDYYIDVSCNFSFVGFNMLIQLNKSELHEYQNNGKDYLIFLVKDIQQYALSTYKDRNIKGDIERIANDSIINFLEKSNN
ncbi:hypothetical protein [Chryseobacterium sp. JAH]|uniref:hypothetical protein n=1 Tax=Chryseobacterium sp. JAH TaxID=1742858 RepID=UPI0007413369|nr:hypothetical protein [Chryseobacterium sp. JAH]KUJ52344.1 hypothetical protein AR685_04795 [Chryseobacterium sp. JAH]